MHNHDDVIKWKHFPCYWPFVRGIRRSPVNSHYKGQWRGALMFSLIGAWINGWAINREADDLRRYRAHYDVIVTIVYNSKEQCARFGFEWCVMGWDKCIAGFVRLIFFDDLPRMHCRWRHFRTSRATILCPGQRHDHPTGRHLREQSPGHLGSLFAQHDPLPSL